MLSNHLNFRCLVFSILFLTIYVLYTKALNLEFEFRHYTSEDGLNSGYISSIIQDHKGFIWLGTSLGLVKYDGYNFTTFQHDPEDSSTLIDNGVSCLMVDSRGDIWVGTSMGTISIFHQSLEKFTHINLIPKKSSIPTPDYIASINEDKNGNIWICTMNGGLIKLIFKSENLKTFQIKRFVNRLEDSTSIPSNNISTILQDGKGRFWVGTFGGGLCRFNPEKETFLPLPRKSNRFIFDMIEDRAGKLWTATATGGLHQFDPETGQFIIQYQHEPNNPNSLSFNRVLKIMEDKNGNIWAGTYGRGLNILSIKTGKFSRYLADPDRTSSISDNNIFSMCKDRFGMIWIGTLNGLNVVDQRPKIFKKILITNESKTFLKGDKIYALMEDRNGQLWIGTEQGRIYQLDRFSREMKDITPNRPITKSPIHKPIRTFYEDKNGNIWIGRDGLDKFDPIKKRFTFYRPGPRNSKNLYGSVALAIWQDDSSILWIGTQTALNRLDLVLNKFTYFQVEPEEKLSWLGNAVWSISGERNGNIWLGNANRGGVSLFNSQTKTFKRFLHKREDPQSLSHNIVNSIHVDRNGILWVGTNRGLDRYDSNLDIFEHFNKKKKLPGAMVSWITEDTKGNLWLVTEQGLARFDRKNHSFKNYSKIHGLPDDILGLTPQNTKSGEIFYFSANEIGSFFPDSLHVDSSPPPVYITYCRRVNFSQGGKSIIEKGISKRKEIILSHQDKILTFEFTALNYRHPHGNLYAYKLDGFTDDWIQLGTERRVSFTNLDPGKYSLHVKAANYDGIWNDQETTLSIIVIAPWWKTPWAYSLYAFWLVSLILFIRRYEMNRQRLKNNLTLKRIQAEHEHAEAERLKEMDRIKTQFFANISHEFRTPLTLIQGPVQQLLRGAFKGNIQKQYEMILDNTNRLLQLINQLLDLAKMEFGTMRLRVTQKDIIPYLRTITNSFSSRAMQMKIKLKFSSSETKFIGYFDLEKIEKILINLLANAFKFTPIGGEICVTIQKASTANHKFEENLNVDDFVSISVSDTGPGIPENFVHRIFERFYQIDDSYHNDEKGSGIGLALCKELTELHHGQIIVKSATGKGTTFNVFLPYKRNYYHNDEIVTTANNFPAIEKGHVFKERTLESELSELTVVHTDDTLILIIEDNADMRFFIHEQLKEFYKIVEAVDGKQGFKLASELIPDLIISDVMMPELDGYQLCQKLKTDDCTSHIPIILLTARAEKKDKINGLEFGADDYLTKPFDSQELMIRVNNLIQQRKKLRQKFSREIKLQPKDITITSTDEKFLKRAIDIVEKHISDPDFNVDKFTDEIGLSRMQLHRKLRSLTDESTSSFIKTLRLKRAAELLKKKSGNISEIAYDVGFSNPAYFSECFKKHFGVLPSEFIKQ